jgi:hypothetical protein
MRTRTKRLRFDYAKLVEESPQGRFVEVSLTFADSGIRATEGCTAETASQLRAAAMAALQAIQVAVGNRFTCRLADLDHVHALGKNLMAVLVDINFEGKDVQVFGSCPTNESELDAAAKAALNATNRFVELASRD